MYKVVSTVRGHPYVIYDVTVLGGREYQGFCDNSAEALVLNCVTMGEGVSKLSKIVWRHLGMTPNHKCAYIKYLNW